MSAARQQTRIFGMRVGIDPKYLVVGLLALAGLIYWLSSGDSSSGHVTTTTANPPATGAPDIAAPPARNAAERSRRSALRRRGNGSNDRGTLRLLDVRPEDGEIDPVLRLDLLERLAKVREISGKRNLFAAGPAPQAAGAVPVPVRTIVPKPIVQEPVAMMKPPTPQANIPFKYYGFAKPTGPGEASRGFFLEGTDILVAAEGQLIKQRYRLVQLTPTSARMEDTQVNLAQNLQVVPEALEQGGGAIGQPQPQQMEPGMMNQGMMQPQEEPSEP